MQLNKNQIAIKSFSYFDFICEEEEVEIQEKKLFKTTKKIEKKNIVRQVTITHAIIYHIDQNRFWYTKFQDDTIIESHHTKNNLENSLKIINDMKKRFLICEVPILSEKEIEDQELLENIKELTVFDNVPTDELPKKKLKGILL